MPNKSTDGAPGTLAKNDGIYAVPVEGPRRGWPRQFLSGPLASEICGLESTPDNLTLFCAIQHPREGGKVTAGRRIASATERHRYLQRRRRHRRLN